VFFVSPHRVKGMGGKRKDTDVDAFLTRRNGARVLMAFTIGQGNQAGFQKVSDEQIKVLIIKAGRREIKKENSGASRLPEGLRGVSPSSRLTRILH